MSAFRLKYRKVQLYLYAVLVLPNAALAGLASSGLRDPPVQGDSVTYLDNRFETNSQQWTASAQVGKSVLKVPAIVPGDLLTDLENANVIGDPYYELNFKNGSLWQNYVWNYSTSFVAPALEDGDELLLVLDGIKMGASISLNGQLLGLAQDQFLRYSFPLVKGGLLLNNKQDPNQLVVSFDPAIPVAGRFMACTGGWDWAPYSDTKAQDTGSSTFSKGIWKSVYLVRVSSATITAVVPQIRYRGNYPVEPLVDGQHAGFDVTVRVHLWAPRTTSGTILVKSSWGAIDQSKVISLSAEKETALNVNLTADASEIKLWWPAGTGPNPSQIGARALYDVHVCFVPSAHLKKEPVAASRRVGFRHFALVTGNDTDPAYVRDSVGKEGTSSLGMWWRVNGLPLWSRGANMIPMEELEGRLNANAHRQLVRSAVEANMNTLRVWGGGMFLPEAWYDACDELGVLVYHDVMYAQNGHDPDRAEIQEAELRHNVRRLATHPSIVVWDGCNECQVFMNTTTSIYADFVLTVVAQEDSTRAVWPSCPAAGWKLGVDRLTSVPTGSHLITPDKDQIKAAIEVHGPYRRGTGFPAVNGGASLQPLAPNIPITISANASAMGISQSNTFASEFGCTTMSSFESMSPTLHPFHWSIHGGAPPDNCSTGFARTCEGGNNMAQRNYPCDSIIEAYFHTEPGYYDGVGEAWFKRQLYHCMIGQALAMKSDIESRRSNNELGHLVWQLNEIWPTGGWGSLEYGNPSYRGQIIGGRWKPLHYFYRASLFADTMATCGAGGACYIRNDAAGRKFHGSVSVKSIDISTGSVDWSRSISGISLAAGPGSVETFHIPAGAKELDGTTHFLTIDVMSSDSSLLSRNVLLLVPPKNIVNLPSSSGLKFSIQEVAQDGTVPILVHAGVPVALFVVLTTQAAGRFSDNAFPVIGGTAQVHFVPFRGEVDIVTLRNTLRVEDLAHHALPPTVDDKFGDMRSQSTHGNLPTQTKQ